MPRKKKEDLVEETPVETSESETIETSVASENEVTETDTSAVEMVEAKQEKTVDAKDASDDDRASAETETPGEPSLVGSVFDTLTTAVSSVAGAVAGGVSSVVSAITPNSDITEEKVVHSKRAEKIGVVSSDKMTRTVVVRVDRVVKHPTYRKYIKRRKKFMAHDELSSAIGDKVRIVETRPLSARKRWRVVEIIQKAEK